MNKRLVLMLSAIILAFIPVVEAAINPFRPLQPILGANVPLPSGERPDLGYFLLVTGIIWGLLYLAVMRVPLLKGENTRISAGIAFAMAAIAVSSVPITSWIIGLFALFGSLWMIIILIGLALGTAFAVYWGTTQFSKGMANVTEEAIKVAEKGLENWEKGSEHAKKRWKFFSRADARNKGKVMKESKDRIHKTNMPPVHKLTLGDAADTLYDIIGNIPRKDTQKLLPSAEGKELLDAARIKLAELLNLLKNHECQERKSLDDLWKKITQSTTGGTTNFWDALTQEEKEQFQSVYREAVQVFEKSHGELEETVKLARDQVSYSYSVHPKDVDERMKHAIDAIEARLEQIKKGVQNFTALEHNLKALSDTGDQEYKDYSKATGEITKATKKIENVTVPSGNGSFNEARNAATELLDTTYKVMSPFSQHTKFAGNSLRNLLTAARAKVVAIERAYKDTGNKDLRAINTKVNKVRNDPGLEKKEKDTLLQELAQVQQTEKTQRRELKTLLSHIATSFDVNAAPATIVEQLNGLREQLTVLEDKIKQQLSAVDSKESTSSKKSSQKHKRAINVVDSIVGRINTRVKISIDGKQYPVKAKFDKNSNTLGLSVPSDTGKTRFDRDLDDDVPIIETVPINISLDHIMEHDDEDDVVVALELVRDKVSNIHDEDSLNDWADEVRNMKP